jgi:hypothetical protein
LPGKLQGFLFPPVIIIIIIIIIIRRIIRIIIKVHPVTGHETPEGE